MFRTRSSIWWRLSLPCLLLAGCMKPMLAEVPFCLTMPEPETRLEQQFILSLSRMVRSNQAGQCYHLDYTLIENKEPIIIDRDGENVRYNLVHTCKFLLRDPSGKPVMRDEVNGVAGFNQVDADYAAYSAQTGTRELLTRDIASQVYSRVVSAIARER